MLVELSIRNLAVVESVRVTFHDGFHVLTGETGAGKSIIIDALSLIVGGRGSADIIRYGCEKAEIEALFDIEPNHPVWETLQNQGIDASPDEHLVIRRELTQHGKSTSRINGQLVNLSMLREAGERLVNIHGQHEHQSLLKVEQHMHWLDLYGEASIRPVKSDYQAAYSAYTATLKELEQLQESSQKTLQMIDLYRFQVEEISAARLKIGEDEWLAEEKRKLSNAEKMMQSVSDAYQWLYGGKGIETVSKAIQKLSDISAYDKTVLNPLVEQLQSAYYQLEDASFQLRDYREQIEFNPDRLEEIEQRLDMINSFRRKYGDNITEILTYLDTINRELDVMERKDEVIAKLQKDADEQYVAVEALARKLSEARHQVAQKLAREIEQELRSLQMERTQFEVSITRQEDPRGWEVDGTRLRFTKHGFDVVEFLLSANPGEPVRSLHKIASGGEMSRIMLAMKAIFAKVDRIPVLVFDEVDTGVSGRAAQSIAEKLSRLSATCQVFSITHLPQVACMADHHYEIRKVVEAERTATKVKALDEQGRTVELARMLGGVEVTETTLHHAKEMLQLAEVKKASTV